MDLLFPFLVYTRLHLKDPSLGMLLSSLYYQEKIENLLKIILNFRQTTLMYFLNLGLNETYVSFLTILKLYSCLNQRLI